MKTTIIGHRGAAGSKLENTIESFKAAVAMGVNAIELDVRKSADNVLMVCHDRDLDRIAGKNLLVRDLTLEQLQKIKLKDGVSIVPTLDEALDVISGVTVLVELKESGCIDEILKAIDRHPKSRVTIISFKLDELIDLRSVRPDISIYLNDGTRATEAIQQARTEGFSGVGLNFWLLNPLAYYLARRANLDIFVYTVNSRILGRMIHWLYPKVAICTDYPEYFLHSKGKRSRASHTRPS